jgi:exodeoxyribonuclease V alpha subunit
VRCTLLSISHATPPSATSELDSSVEHTMRTNHAQQQSEAVSGEVSSVRMIREGWGRAELVGVGTVTGPVLGIAVGDTVEARGRWHEDPRWGKQFKAQTVRTTLAGDTRGAIAWLSSRLPGLGKTRATQLVERFGVPALYEVIAQRPEELCVVKGITPELAAKIQEEHERVRGETEEMTTLLGWGLTDGQVRRCKEAWGKSTLEVLRADPYRLAEEVYGFGFKRADEIARRMGLPTDHPRRLQACCLHVLREAEGNGHCFIRRKLLLKIAMDELAAASVRVGQVAEQLDVVLEEGRAVEVEDRVYLPDTRAAERDVARRVVQMLSVRVIAVAANDGQAAEGDGSVAA